MILRVKTCIKCGRERPMEAFRALGSQMCGSCSASRVYDRLRVEFLEEFGCKCSCCGETHPYFLTLEHVKPMNYRKNGMKEVSRAAVLRQAKREGWDRTKYDCLCISCNFAGGLYGQCPHKSGITKEQILDSWKRNSSFRSKKSMAKGWKKKFIVLGSSKYRLPEAV